MTTMQIPRKSPAFLLVRICGDAYAYSGETDAFTRVPRMPLDLPEQLESALLHLHSIDQGKTIDTEKSSLGSSIQPCMGTLSNVLS